MLPNDKRQVLKLGVPVTHLMRDAALRPRPAVSKVVDGRFTLNIMPLARMIGIFQAHKATISHDKIYALLGLCSDDLDGSGLLPDYQLLWAELLKRLIFYTLGAKAYVKTWDGQAIFYTLGAKAYVKTWDGQAVAILEAYGNMVGRVATIEDDTSGGSAGRRTLIVEATVGYGTKSVHRRTFLCDTEDARPDDMVCSIGKSRRIVLVRHMGDYFGIIDIALEAVDANESLAKPSDEVGSSCISLLLAWDFGSRWPQDERHLDSVFHSRVSAILDENAERYGDAGARSWAVANALWDADMVREAAVMFAAATRGRADDNTVIIKRQVVVKARFLKAIGTHDSELTQGLTRELRYLECLAWLFDSWSRADDANTLWLLIYATRRVISMPPWHFNFSWHPMLSSKSLLLTNPSELLRAVPDSRSALELVSQRGKPKVPVTLDLARKVDLGTRGGKALMDAILGMDETVIEPEAARHLFPDVTEYEEVRDYAVQRQKIERKESWVRGGFRRREPLLPLRFSLPLPSRMEPSDSLRRRRNYRELYE